MMRSTRYLGMSSAVLLGACVMGNADDRSVSGSGKSFHVSSTAWAQPVTHAAMSADEAKRLGAKAGVVSPRLADCGEHCAKMLGDVKGVMSEQRRMEFTQSCREACEKEMADVRGPARQRAHKAARDWQSLYLMGTLMEQSVFCIGKLGDRSAEASALVKALEAAKKTPEALAADELEREAGKVVAELALTEEGRREKTARDALARANADGPRSAAADAAREAVSEAHAAAEATPVGKRMLEAMARAHDARAKANENTAMSEAGRAWEAHNEAFRARVRSSPPQEQPRLQQALTECFKAYGEEQMRGRAQP